MTPIQPDNWDTQKQLEQWLKEVEAAELSEEQQTAISHLMAELQDLPSASISPRLEGRLHSLSQRQLAPTNPFKRFLAFLGAGLATAGAVLLWQSSERLKVAKATRHLLLQQSTENARARSKGNVDQHRIPTHSSQNLAPGRVTIRQESH